MSVDVFGRKLNKKEGSRGPPGIGYKITEDDQFDADGKRISNLAHPHKSGDAVNLDFLTQLLDAEVRNIRAITHKLQKKIDDLNRLIVKQHPNLNDLSDPLDQNKEKTEVVERKRKRLKVDGELQFAVSYKDSKRDQLDQKNKEQTSIVE